MLAVLHKLAPPAQQADDVGSVLDALLERGKNEAVLEKIIRM